MHFTYEVVRLWERPAAEFLAADLGVVPLAVLGRLPEDLSLEDGLAAVARRVVERLARSSAGLFYVSRILARLSLHFVFRFVASIFSGGSLPSNGVPLRSSP